MPRVLVRGRKDEAGNPLIQSVSDAELQAHPDLYQSLDTGPVLAQTATGEAFAISPEGLRASAVGDTEASSSLLATEAQKRAQAEQYGGVVQGGIAALEGLGDAATGGTLTQLRVLSGDTETREAIRGRAAEHSGVRTGAKIIGDVGLGIASGGTSLAAKGAAKTIPGLLAQGTERLVAGQAGKGLARQVAAGALGGAGEGAVGAVGDYLVDQALTENAPLSGEALIASMGKGALFGGVGGAAGAGLSVGGNKLLKQLEKAGDSPAALSQVVEEVDDVVVEKGGASIIGAANDQVSTTGTKIAPASQRTPEEAMAAAGRVVQAVDASAGTLRTAKQQIKAVTAQVPPAQAFEMQAKLEAHNSAILAARKHARAMSKKVGEGKSIADDADGLSILANVEKTQRELDETIAAGYKAAGLEAPAPTIPLPPLKENSATPPAIPTDAPAVSPPVKVDDLPDGFERGPHAQQATIYKGLPGFQDVDPKAVYVTRADELAPLVDDTMGGAGVDVARKDSIKAGLAEGKKFDPIIVSARSNGRYEIVDGRHRLAAAVDEGRDIPVRMHQHVADLPDDAVKAGDDIVDLSKYERDPATGEYFDPKTGEVLDMGLVTAQRKLDRIRKVSGDDVPNWLKKSIKERGTKKWRETIIDAGTGQEAKGWKPRSTDREYTPAFDAVSDQARPMRPAIDVRDVRPKAESQDIIDAWADYTQEATKAADDWKSQWGDAFKDKPAVDDWFKRVRPELKAKAKELGLVDEFAEQAIKDIETPNKGPDLAEVAEAKATSTAAEQASEAPSAPAQSPEAAPTPTAAATETSPTTATEAPQTATVADEIAPTPAVEAPSAVTETAPTTTDKANPLDAVSLPSIPDSGKSARLRELASRVQDVAGYMEIAQELGIAGVPDVDKIPVIGPILGAYLKLRTIAGRGRVGQLIGTKGGVKAAEQVTRVRSAIDTGVKALATGATSRYAKGAIKAIAKTANQLTNTEDAKREIEEVRRLVNTPGLLEQRVAGQLAGAPEPVIEAAQQVARAKAEWLASKAPRQPLADTPFAQDWSPSATQARDWQITTEVADHPENAIGDLLGGRYNSVAVDALRNVYPELYASVQQQLTARIDDIMANAPRARRVQVSRAFGIPLDSSVLPWYQTALLAKATAAAAQGDPTQQPQAPQPSMGPPRFTESMATGPEARAMRRR